MGNILGRRTLSIGIDRMPDFTVRQAAFQFGVVNHGLGSSGDVQSQGCAVSRSLSGPLRLVGTGIPGTRAPIKVQPCRVVLWAVLASACSGTMHRHVCVGDCVQSLLALTLHLSICLGKGICTPVRWLEQVERGPSRMNRRYIGLCTRFPIREPRSEKGMSTRLSCQCTVKKVSMPLKPFGWPTPLAMLYYQRGKV